MSDDVAPLGVSHLQPFGGPSPAWATAPPKGLLRRMQKRRVPRWKAEEVAEVVSLTM